MPHEEGIGRLCCRNMVFEWTIPVSNFEGKDGYFYSPNFRCFENDWYFSIWTKFVWKTDKIDMRLNRHNASSMPSVWFTVALKTAMGMEILCDECMANNDWLSTSKYLPKSDLLRRGSQLAPLRTLTFICTLKNKPPSTEGRSFVSNETQREDLRDDGTGEDDRRHLCSRGQRFVSCATQAEDMAEDDATEDNRTHPGIRDYFTFIGRQINDVVEGYVAGVAVREENLAHVDREGQRFVSCATQTEDLTDDGAREDNRTRLGTRGGAIQQKHFKDLLLEGQDHDVTLKVKDREFRAHKCVLRARSPVFAAMFAHNMKEAESGDVTIEDCDSKVFGEFLEYIYSGKIDNLNPRSSLGLYYAGDKYDIPDLKEMCVEILKTSLSTNVVCDVISLAMKHREQELQDCAMSFFANNFEEILLTVEWQRFLDSNPIVANELIIKTMKSSFKRVEV